MLTMPDYLTREDVKQANFSPVNSYLRAKQNRVDNAYKEGVNRSTMEKIKLQREQAYQQALQKKIQYQVDNIITPSLQALRNNKTLSPVQKKERFMEILETTREAKGFFGEFDIHFDDNREGVEVTQMIGKDNIDQIQNPEIREYIKNSKGKVQVKTEIMPDGSVIVTDIDNLKKEYDIANSVIEKNENLIFIADKLLNDPELSIGTGKSGQFMSIMPGSKAYDIRADIKTLIANQALSAINELAKSGVSLTPMSDTDIALLREAQTNLDPNQSDDKFRENLKKFRDTLIRVNEKYADEILDMDYEYSTDRASSIGSENQTQSSNVMKTKNGYVVEVVN